MNCLQTRFNRLLGSNETLKLEADIPLLSTGRVHDQTSSVSNDAIAEYGSCIDELLHRKGGREHVSKEKWYNALRSRDPSSLTSIEIPQTLRRSTEEHERHRRAL